MIGIETWRLRSRRRSPREGRDIEDVVEVPVGDDDPPDALLVPAVMGERMAQETSAADESSVEQVEPGSIAQDMKFTQGREPARHHPACW